MLSELALVFQGISTASALVGAVKSAYETKKLVREDVQKMIGQAAVDAEKVTPTAEKAARRIAQADEDLLRVTKGKIEKAQAKFRDDFDKNDDPADWNRAADELRITICSILRAFKQVNGGRLTDEWYDLWVRNQCS